jgi:hypothetical protein
MEASGIIIVAFTMFGMLIRLVTSLTTDHDTSATSAMQPPIEAHRRRLS